MSTRGAVGIGTPDQWTAVYNHWDSYPSGLGADVWNRVQEVGVDHIRKHLLDYGDWREYLNEGVCEYCGKKAGQPVNIMGTISCIQHEIAEYPDEGSMKAYYSTLPAWKGRTREINRMVKEHFAIRKLIEETGYPDPEAKYHDHAAREDGTMTQDTADALWIEYVYLIDPKEPTMYILACYDTGETYMEQGHHGPYEAHKYDHYHVINVDLEGPEPNWEEIDGLRWELREEIEAAHK